MIDIASKRFNNCVCIAEIIRCIDFRCASEGAAGVDEHISKSIRCSRSGARRRDMILLCILSSLSGREFETCAFVEHVFITTLPQRRSRQRGNLDEIGAILEHAVIAITRQRGSRQSGCLNETGATVEHFIIAPSTQRGSRQRWSLSETGATGEHAFIAIIR